MSADEPVDPLKDMVALKDQYLTAYRHIIIPLCKEVNEIMKAERFEVEIRARIIARVFDRLTVPQAGAGRE